MPMIIPALSELTDEQLEIQDLPINGRYMIIGGPGTGKTSLALHRTKHIIYDNPNSKIASFLFTNALNDFFADGINTLEIRSNVCVWAKWQMAFLKRHGITWPRGVEPPWDQLSNLILKHPINKQFDHLIIDEAQDFSSTDLQVMGLLSDNITVFIDPNQRLYKRGVGAIKSVQNVLQIDDESCYTLHKNLRNTKKIIQAAQSIAPNVVNMNIDNIKKIGREPRIIRYRNEDDEVDLIINILRNDRQKDIGVLHLENSVIRRLYEKLSIKNNHFDIELLKNGNFNFSRPSLKLCTLNSAKGLEFDIVIMPVMDKNHYFNNPVNLKRIYVGMTRAKEDLILSYSGAFPATYISDIKSNYVKHINKV